MVFYLGERSNWDSEVKEQSLPYPPLKRRAEISALEVLLTYPNFPFHILCSVDLNISIITLQLLSNAEY